MSSSETEKQIHFYRTIFYMKHVSAGVFYAITCNLSLYFEAIGLIIIIIV